MSGITIRPAIESDAETAAELLRRSITELCVADHGNDPAFLDPWLANKTPEMFRTWLDKPDNVILVAEIDGMIAGVGSCRRDGEITLTYVSPDKRFAGISTALLAGLEAELSRLGNSGAVLESTRTAHDFYLARGYVDIGADDEGHDATAAFVMTKLL